MKKALEAAVVLAVLGLGAYVVRAAFARRELAAHPVMMNPASAPGVDAENPDAPPVRPIRGLAGLPMVKLTRPAKPARRDAAVPPPAAPSR